MEYSSQLSFKSRYFYLKFLFAFIAAILISSLKLDYIESFFYDQRVSLRSHIDLYKKTDPKVAVVLINSKTIEAYQGNPSYGDHTKLIQTLNELNAKYIVYEFRQVQKDFFDIEGTFNEKLSFADEIKNIKNFYISTQDLKMKGEKDDLKLNPPLDVLKLYSFPISADSKLFAKDGVTRRLMFQYQDQSMMHPILASYYNPELLKVDNIQGQFDLLDSKQVYIHYYPKNTFPTFSFEDVIHKKIPTDIFKDKIVVVGTDLGRSTKDYVATPMLHEPTAMPVAELQAHQLQTMIDNNAPMRAPKFVDQLLTVIMCLFTVYVTLALKPSRGLVILGATLVSYVILATILFIIFNLWIDLAHPLLALFLCYYFFIPYRLIKENRRSWEYYQKHQLLTQVEELKTNFISMMSHDLKTPIARIQGMTEVIYKDQQPLSNSQRDAIDTIRSSSDDLLKFINAILQYGRIESQGIELHRQSKDINQLLIDVVKKHEFLAKVKRIKIQQELEPMFPVQVDPELLKQVFSNLLENAIKYSPEDSVVTVRSREDGDKVLVDFIDQGIGIPEMDLPNIFMKFFRTHTVKTSTIKGSGLGLYLAKYFIELHKGQISAQSELNKGSIFTVELSINT
ncbi:MAG: CHASE2 domain-containing protein [Pseudobdellovibrio sp.]